MSSLFLYSSFCFSSHFLSSLLHLVVKLFNLSNNFFKIHISKHHLPTLLKRKLDIILNPLAAWFDLVAHEDIDAAFGAS